MRTKINFTLALGMLLLASFACSFSTANLSELKFDKDKSASNPTMKFNPEDEVFAITSVNNAGGAHQVKFRLLFDEVEGAKSGTLAYKVEREMKTEGSQKVWLNFGVPGGFAPGSYKVEVVLSDEGGKELDRKSGGFTISGEKGSQAANPASTSGNSSSGTSDASERKPRTENVTANGDDLKKKVCEKYDSCGCQSYEQCMGEAERSNYPDAVLECMLKSSCESLCAGKPDGCPSAESNPPSDGPDKPACPQIKCTKNGDCPGGCYGGCVDGHCLLF